MTKRYLWLSLYAAFLTSILWFSPASASLLNKHISRTPGFAPFAGTGEARSLFWPGPPLLKHAAGLPLPCQSTGFPTPCYTPHQIEMAYGETPLLAGGFDGRGQSITIVDADQDPSLSADLHAYDEAFGLPDPRIDVTSVDCNLALTWSCQPGAPGSSPADPGYSLETSIDVEWAHALAPRAAIHLIMVDVSTASSAEEILQEVLAAAGYAVDQHIGQVLSLSVSFAEQCSSPAFLSFEHAVFQKAAQANITVLDSAGDTGSTQFTCDASSFFPSPTVGTPASDPLVLAVGGTHLDAAPDGTYKSETAWAQLSVTNNNGAGGGGFSNVYALPSYQVGMVPGAWRGIPDVALDGDPTSGYIVECSFCNGGQRVWFALGGTSIGAPAWAGLIALANQLAGRALGFVNPALYQIAHGPRGPLAFHDILAGNNQYAFTDAQGQAVTVPGHQAGPRWDAVTGLGSPDATVLLPSLVTRMTRP